MNIQEISIGGFANIELITLALNRFNALIALNNYGKSNVMRGIDFGFKFIGELDKKSDMMAVRRLIPINKHIEGLPYQFEVKFKTSLNQENVTAIYRFEFEWLDSKDQGKRITNEFLKIKKAKAGSKFKDYIKRDSTGAYFLPSETGRCDKKIKAKNDELLINKLKSYDELFYQPLIENLNSIQCAKIDTLKHPDRLFRTISANIVQTGYSLKMPENANVAYFIYSLMKNEPNLYEIFKDSVISLLHDVEDFEPIEIDFKSQFEFDGEKDQTDSRINFPDKIYDIRVKERHNRQQSAIAGMSSGSQKVFYILALTIAAELNQVPLVLFEELENSIHPSLLQQLLIILDGLTQNTKIITSSHSPYLIQYLSTDKIKVGVPNDRGLAYFSAIRKSKFNKVIKMAEEEGVSVGDFIFDKIIECADGERELLNELCI